MGKMLQKVGNCKQVKGIATNGNSDPSCGRRTSGKPAFLGGGTWAEKAQ